MESHQNKIISVENITVDFGTSFREAVLQLPHQRSEQHLPFLTM